MNDWFVELLWLNLTRGTENTQLYTSEFLKKHEEEMLTTNGLHSVVKEGCGIASEASKCLKRKLRNALCEKWVSR